MTNDFPTPPFPLTTAMMFRISRLPSRSIPGARPGRFSAGAFALFCSLILSSLSSVFVIAVVSTVTVLIWPFFLRAFSTSDWSVLASGQWATVSAIFTLTLSPVIVMSRTMLRSTMLIPISGSSTPRRLSRTVCLSIMAVERVPGMIGLGKVFTCYYRRVGRAAVGTVWDGLTVAG